MKYQKGSFITVPNKEALDGLMPFLQIVFLWICCYADDKGVCFPSRTTLARNSGCSLKTIDRAIEGLCNAGLLKKVKRIQDGKNLTNIYQIMLIESLSGVPESLPSVPQSLGVASHSRTELNPVLTQSNNSEAPLRVVDENPRKKADTDYKQVFDLFSKTKKGWMFHKPQIEAAKRLLGMHSLSQIRAALTFYNEHKGEKHFYEIHKPYDLEAKWDNLLAYKKKI